MAILNAKTQAKTQADPMEIPPELRRAPNGKATPDVQALLERIAQLEAQVASKTTIKLKVGVRQTDKTLVLPQGQSLQQGRQARP
jgi:hypothetical protein